MTADPAPSGAAASVLIVEDNPDTSQMLAPCLRLHGYDAVTAANGQEAFDRLNDRTPALLLVDLMMPVMDGIAFRAAQREHPRAAAVPIVVFSAAPEGRAIVERIGADAFLAKPIELTALVSVVARLARVV